MEAQGMSFEDNLRRKIGERNDTLFWKDDWLNQGKVIDKHPQLYNLSTQSNCFLKELGHWVNRIWTWDFKWRRELRDTELHLKENLMLVVNLCTLQDGIHDSWTWSASSDGLYYVYPTYDIIQEESPYERGILFTSLWEAPTQSDALAFGWRVIHDRIQTRVKLRRRQVCPQAGDVMCPLCMNDEKTSAHLLFT